MSISENDPTKDLRPLTAQSEEQRLCNEALASHQFDEITDEQWVALCEQVALDARHNGDDAVTEPASS